MLNRLQFSQQLKLVPHTTVLSICLPLFENFGISFFNYTRIYPDGSRFNLCTNHDFLNWAYAEKLTVASSFNAYIEDGLVFLKNVNNFLPKQQVERKDLQILGARNYFDIDLIENGSLFN